ncbi:MAG: hypothetical protein IPG04_08220 [Polyangiaceae bacterium]|nr:hypothetical protein [Polyangiaceae bacterium]
MLSADVRFEGFTQSDWSKVLSLFRPRAIAGKERDPERPRGGVIAVHEGGRLRKLLHTQAGRLRLEDAAAGWPLGCEELAARNHASWACKIESGALENVMERFGGRVKRGDDLTAQALLFVTLIRDEMLARRIELYPARLSGVPVPTSGMVDRTLDAVCPRGHAMLLGLFDGGELWTSCALRRGSSGGFDWVMGPDEIRRDMGLLAGDWRRDYRHLARAIERKVGKLSLGVFAETSTFRALEVDATPGAWARAVAIRDVILAPVPVALAIPLGIDAGRAAVSALTRAADRAEGLAVVSPLLGVLRGAVQQAAEVAGLIPADGEGRTFDPLEILRRLLSRER